MKKVVLLITILVLIFVSYLTYLNITDYYKNNSNISNIKEEINKLDNNINEYKIKNDNLNIDKNKKAVLEVWEKELKRVKITSSL